MKADKKFTKAKKNDALDKIAKYVGPKIKALKHEERFTYSEVAEFSGLLHPRISELVHKGFLPEKTLVGLIAGGFVRTSEILRELKGQLDEGQQRYVESFAVHEMGRMKRMLVEMIRRGDNPEKAVESQFKEMYGEEALRAIDNGEIE